MKTKQELYESFLLKKEKIPKDVLDIYYSKKENVNGLNLGGYYYEEKIRYLKQLSKSLVKKINNNKYLIGSSNIDMDNGNSFIINCRTEYNGPLIFNIIASIPFKYYNIKRYGDRKISPDEEFIIEKIIELLEEEGYKSISSEICDIETDIIGVNSMPCLYYSDVLSLQYPDFKKISKEEQIEYIKDTDYGGPYTIYNVIFGEHW